MIFETHPGGGLYDCLSIRRRDSTALIDLNRNGSAHVFAADGEHTSLPEFWDNFVSADDPRDVLQRLEQLVDVRPPPTLPAATPETLVWRFIATFMARTVFSRKTWRCLMGVLDTSGYGGGNREKLFAAFDAPDVQASPDDSRAYRFWFLCEGNKLRPAVALHTRGTVWTTAGAGVSLLAEYESSGRRLDQVVSRLCPSVT